MRRLMRVVAVAAGALPVGALPGAARGQETVRVNVSGGRVRMTSCASEPRPTGWLGVTFSVPRVVELGADRAPRMTFAGAIVVEAVQPGSPASRAGLQPGDSIVALNGDPVAGRAVDFRALLKPGEPLAVRYRRGGQDREARAQIVARPEGPDQGCLEAEEGRRLAELARLEALDGLRVAFGDGAEYLAGARLSDLTEDLAELTGARRGVFVVSVGAGSPAAEGGLRSADVITKVGETEVSSPAEVRAAVRRWGRGADPSDDGGLTLAVVRKRKPVGVTLSRRPR